MIVSHLIFCPLPLLKKASFITKSPLVSLPDIFGLSKKLLCIRSQGKSGHRKEQPDY